MKHLVSVGGGFSSTIELPLEVIRRYGADNVHLFIACLKGESSDLWKLVNECERLTGLHVHRLTYAPSGFLLDAPEYQWWSIWDVFNSVGRMGSSLADPCSRLLKRETIKKYLLQTFDLSQSVLHVGITSDEIDRALAIRKNWGAIGLRVDMDLADCPASGLSSYERSMQMLGWSPVLYERGFSHNNCGGFCVKAGHSEMGRLLYYDPALYDYHETNELLFQRKNNTSATIMRDRKTKNRVTTSYPLTMREFALRKYHEWYGVSYPVFEASTVSGCVFCDAAG